MDHNFSYNDEYPNVNDHDNDNEYSYNDDHALPIISKTSKGRLNVSFNCFSRGIRVYLNKCIIC
jgi:hypothetical protein